MDREDEKKFTLVEYNWHIINNLREFNNKPELIEDLYNKMVGYLPQHTTLLQFYDYYKTALEYYDNHSQFPDIQWFEVNYAKSGKFKRTSGEFSIQVYEDCEKLVDAEIIKKDMTKVIQSVQPDISDLRALNSVIAKYCDNAATLPPVTKSDMIDMYDEDVKDYTGIYTGISKLDDVIGVMGHKSLTVFGAPSGHGKSTFAINVAFNAAVHQGLCVDYISYEVPKEHIWFNLVSLMSYELGTNLEASKMKEGKLTEDEKIAYKNVSEALLAVIKDSGGYINIIDQTTAAVDTFEGLCARIEGIATERTEGKGKDKRVFDRKADLIIIDNVDNLQILKSSERDEQTRVNNYIIKLDSFCKQYHHGDGCCIMLLTQLNRGGLQKLQRAEQETDAREKTKGVDVTVFQKFNALYEKPTCCLVGFADPAMRISHRMTIYAVKLRNRGVPDEPINLSADYAFSKIGGAYESIDGGQMSRPQQPQWEEEVTDVSEELFDYEDEFDTSDM